MGYVIKNIYTVFFTSSAEELKYERLRLTDFVNNFSVDYLEQFFEIRLKPVSCASEDKQAEYDDAIRESRMCFFVFDKEVSDYTEHELEVAKAAFDKTELPKIYFFFKKPHGEQFSEEVAALQAKLDKDFGHYYTFFEDIDTVHLRIVLQIMRQVLPEVSIELKDGQVLARNMPIPDVDPMSLPEFRNNKDLARMREEYAALDAECRKLYEQFKQPDCPADIIAEYSRKAAERARLKEETEQLLANIFNISKEICSESGVVDAKRRAAYRYLEEGDSKKALEMLDEGELLAEGERVLSKAREARAEAQSLIDAWKLRIDILLTMTEDKERFSKVRAAYETIEKLVDEVGVGAEKIRDYARFLRIQNDHKLAYDKALKYVHLLESKKVSGKNVTDKALCDAYDLVGVAARSLNRYVEAKEYLKKAYDLAQHLGKWAKARESFSLGILYCRTRDFDKASKYYRETLIIIEDLSKAEPSAYAPDLAGTYNNLGILHEDLNEYDKAREYYEKALKMYKQLDAENSSAYAPDLAMTYNNLGNLHAALKEYDKAREYHEKALGIKEELNAENPSAYAPDLATTYNNLGMLYWDLKEYDKAREYHEKALGIKEKLNAENPSVYAPDLAATYNNLGKLHYGLKEYDKAREYHEKALGIKEKLNAENPSVYAPDLATTYYNLGILHQYLKEYGKAREYHEKALGIKEKLNAENLSAYAPALAGAYNALGNLHKDLKEYDKAREYHEKALEIRKKLNAENPSVYAPDLATTYYNLGILHHDLKEYNKAREYYEKALEIWEKLNAENPSAYAPDLTGTYNNLGILHKDLKEYGKAREYYEKALKMYKQLDAENSSAYAPDLAMIYNNLGVMHQDLKEYDKAREWFEKALQLCESHHTIRPELLIKIRINLGKNYYLAKDYETAWDHYQEAKLIGDRLYAENKQAYASLLSTIYNGLGDICYAIDEPELGQGYYYDARNF